MSREGALLRLNIIDCVGEGLQPLRLQLSENIEYYLRSFRPPYTYMLKRIQKRTFESLWKQITEREFS
jgi:hypothetical protein